MFAGAQRRMLRVMNTTHSNSASDNRIPPRRQAPDNWLVQRRRRRDEQRFDWGSAGQRAALLGTLGRPFA